VAFSALIQTKDSLFPVGSAGCEDADELKPLKCFLPFQRLQLDVIRMSNDQSIFALDLKSKQRSSIKEVTHCQP